MAIQNRIICVERYIEMILLLRLHEITEYGGAFLPKHGVKVI